MAFYIPVSYSHVEGIYVKSMGYEDNPELARWRLCRRNHCILHYVTKGKGYFDGHEVREGQGFYIDTENIHEYYSSDDEPWEYFWIIFSEESSKNFFLPFIELNEHGVFSYSFIHKLERFCSKISKANSPLNHHEALSFFMTLISFHNSHTEYDVAPKRHIRAAKTYIESNYNRKLLVSDVAAALHLNERYLYNIFVKYEKCTPKKYIDKYKISVACEMLTNTDTTVSEIAKHCGFDDVCSFSKFFSANVGESPTIYRNKNS